MYLLLVLYDRGNTKGGNYYWVVYPQCIDYSKKNQNMTICDFMATSTLGRHPNGLNLVNGFSIQPLGRQCFFNTAIRSSMVFDLGQINGKQLVKRALIEWLMFDF